ncbi:dimethyl sulfoxide reductase anchor subunit [Rhodobacter sp. Har01]|uniref:dimethyl sulfoxide reductase anchor subunit family protein n=1 Tax=Rhodobacter sp. Har01 TaxID=2883999 RepID=UPI001D08207C|nr:DmsC/YnfH family molybdoenzyme membrane anchor subunit [Rhodobacter sp. Har01]MCB6176793.1 dimethyl sulfoxide reductase anchor subunit [Rhodobacter sp. Har01]
MHPAPSVILFTVLSGLGFGVLAVLGLGALPLAGWAAAFAWGLGYALAVGGLGASTFHLGNPQRAWRAFSQWRTSWLSREAWASVAALLVLAPTAMSDVFGWGLPRILGGLGAALAALAVLCTGMIYAQLRTVPRWNHWITPALFLAFAALGGAIVTVRLPWALGLCAILAGLLVAAFQRGDGAFAARGATLGSATGLDRLGAPAVFELPHSGPNYLTREMIFVVGRRHAAKLRVLAVVLACLLPAAILAALPAPVAAVLATAVHLAGAFAARWLFFAEAEHVVGLYYGRR